MVMVKVPKGTFRKRRTDNKPETEWDIGLRLPAIGAGNGEAIIGYTVKMPDGTTRAFPAHATSWADHPAWIPAVQWLVETYKAHLNTSEALTPHEDQHVAQQHEAELSGNGQSGEPEPQLEDWLGQ